MFALVKYKCNNAVEGIPIESIRLVTKENGVKSFTPFEPKHINDFVLTKKLKYVVFKNQEDGSLKRWYIMIGRLGASLDEVLDNSNEHVLWRKSDCSSGITATNDQFSLMNAATKDDVPWTVTASASRNCSQVEGPELMKEMQLLAPSDISFDTNNESFHKRVKDVEDAVLKAQKLIEQLTDQVSKLFPGFQNLVLDAMEKINKHFLDRLECASNVVFQRIVETEALVNNLQDQVEKSTNMNQVLAWVNNCKSVNANASNTVFEAADVSSESMFENKKKQILLQQELFHESNGCDGGSNINQAEVNAEDNGKFVSADKKDQCRSDDDIFNEMEES